MAKSKYKRYGQGGRFKNQGQGLRASVDAIRQQRQVEIDALKIQAGQQKEIDKQQISGLENKARVERSNREILRDLENRIYRTKADALTVRAETEVDSILGQAKEKERESKFWSTFATEHSKSIGKLATGLGEFGLYLQAVQNDKWNRKNNPDKHDQFSTAMQLMYAVNDEEMVNAAFKAKGHGAIEELLPTMVGKQDRSNRRNSQKSVDDLVKNINTVVQSIKNSYGDDLNADNINTVFENAGYLLSFQRNIRFNSREHTRLLEVLNFKANAQAEEWRSKTRFDNDKKKQEEFSKGTVALHKDYIQETDPVKKENLLKEIQTRHKQFHLLIQESFQDLGYGKYGRVPLNPREINSKIIDLTFNEFEFTDITEAEEVYNRYEIFNKDDGSTIKEKGKSVGMIEKSGELKNILIEKIEALEKQQDKDQKLIEKGKRLQKVKDIITEWDGAKKSGDYSVIMSDEFQNKVERLAMDPSFTQSSGNDELNILYRVIGYGRKERHGSLSDFLEIKGLLYAGYEDEATNELLRLARDNGGNVPPGFASLFDNAKLITELSGQGTSITNAGEDMLKDVYGASMTIIGDEKVDMHRYRRMQQLVEHRILDIMMEDSTDDSPQSKFNDAYTKVKEEVREGLEKGTGLFAVKSKATTLAPLDPKSDYRARAGAADDVKAADTTQGLYFLAVDDRVIGGADINESNIDELVLKDPTSNVLRQSLKANFGDPDKSILSSDQKRELIKMATLSKYESSKIPSSMKVLIARVKLKDPTRTSKEIMNDVLDAITESDEYSSYKGVSWTANHEDVTKKLIGTCKGSAKNNFALCMTSKFKSEEEMKQINIDIKKGLTPKLEKSDKQVYDVLTNQGGK